MFEELTPPYATIVVDPPWHYDGTVKATNGRGGGKPPVAIPLPYSTMTVAEIAAMPIVNLTDGTDARVFLWTTNKYLPEAFGILDAWRFRYAQTIVWHKTGNPSPFGGSVAPIHAEFLIVGRMGNLAVTGRWESSVIASQKPNAQHSLKPGVFGDFVEAVSPGPYVELFARQPRMGWDAWGRGFE